MFRLQIPYNKVLLNPRDFDPEELDSLLRHFIDFSRKHPVVLEVFNEYIQFLLFIGEGQIYWAATNDGNGFNEITIKEFFSRLKRTQFPQIVSYHTDLTLYHSLLVYLQRKPDLKVSSSLVDLDDLLDKAEKGNVSALVAAFHPGNLILLRYKNGKAVACYHGYAGGQIQEADAREEFLVKIYTISTHHPFQVSLFTNLTATHSEDARSIPADYNGTISSFYLSQPPRLVVKLKNRPLKTYSFAGKEMTIGRLPENGIVIDNLSVSRRHAVIASRETGYILSDLGSKNGTFLNGKQVEETELKNGDTITIGKYQVIFQVPNVEDNSIDNMDQTVIIPNYHENRNSGNLNIQFPASKDAVPKLYRISSNEEHILDKERILIGRSKNSDIHLSGLMGPRVELEITRNGSDYLLRKTKGHKKLTINGEEMEQKILEEEDLIAIGPEEFVFKR